MGGVSFRFTLGYHMPEAPHPIGSDEESPCPPT
jgi:hypothetical protein